jgi:hypothetical protein
VFRLFRPFQPIEHARTHDGRRRDRGERAGQGFGVYGAPPRQRQQLGKSQKRRTIFALFLLRRSMVPIGTKRAFAAMHKFNPY